jgi:hypothetical protein
MDDKSEPERRSWMKFCRLYFLSSLSASAYYVSSEFATNHLATLVFIFFFTIP